MSIHSPEPTKVYVRKYGEEQDLGDGVRRLALSAEGSVTNLVRRYLLVVSGEVLVKPAGRFNIRERLAAGGSTILNPGCRLEALGDKPAELVLFEAE
jgi:hypothetical protein